MRASITGGGLAGALIVLVIAAVCVRLGVWQLDRLDERRERNAAYSAALALPPIELRGDTLDAVLRNPAAYLYRRARVIGAPALDSEVVWRGRSLGGRPGVNILTPYRMGDGVMVLVNRGWAPSPDAARVDLRDFRESIRPAPVGVLVPLPAAPDHARAGFQSSAGERVLSVQQPDAGVLAEHLAASVLPLYVQQVEPSGEALPAALPTPDPGDEGPHLGYAIQWFSFAAIAVLGFVAVVLLRSRNGPV